MKYSSRLFNFARGWVSFAVLTVLMVVFALMPIHYATGDDVIRLGSSVVCQNFQDDLYICERLSSASDAATNVFMVDHEQLTLLAQYESHGQPKDARVVALK